MSKKLPSSPCAWDRDAINRIYGRIGAENGRRIPSDTHGVFNVDGWRVIVRRSDARGRSGKPRVFVDNGGWLIPAGRVRQALCQKVLLRSRRIAARHRSVGGRFRGRYR